MENTVPGPNIDRIEPTRRPAGTPKGYQQWRSLLFLHWRVPPDALRALVPQQLELDLWNGVAYVGVVPFFMRGVRPRYVPQRLAFNFLETNVRTYVHYRGRPGVYFFSLEASSRIAVWAARVGWGLPYHHARMSCVSRGDSVHYESRRVSNEARHFVSYSIGEELGASAPGSIEHFLLERYLLFLVRRNQLIVGRVYHTPYPAQRATVHEVDDQLVAAAGLPQPSGLPELVHYASGVDVEIFPLKRC
jgi:uncharacterized protein YqjF (DUF2071 family)